MSIQIKVPAMGESVTEATVARWFKKEGDAVKRDEPVLELETDKVTVEVPAPADGAIESISVAEGATVQVGTILGAIAEGKAGKPVAVAAAHPDAASPKPAPGPHARRERGKPAARGRVNPRPGLAEPPAQAAPPQAGSSTRRHACESRSAP